MSNAQGSGDYLDYTGARWGKPTEQTMDAVEAARSSLNREDRGCRELAAAVFLQAFSDITESARKDGGVHRRQAMAFLFAPSWKQMRVLWLDMLDMTEESMWRLMGRDTFFGQPNRLPREVRIKAISLACNNAQVH